MAHLACLLSSLACQTLWTDDAYDIMYAWLFLHNCKIVYIANISN